MQNNNIEDTILGWMHRKKRIEGTLSSNLPERTLSFSHLSEFDKIRSHLEYFTDNIAYLKSRRTKSLFEIENEADVQDLLFVMLKPSFPSMTFEDPSAKTASGYSIKDLYFPLSKIILEAKYIGTTKDVKQIEKQLHDDIMKYSSNVDCEIIIFFIYDPNLSIPDRRTFVQKLSQEKGEFMHNGREIIITTIIAK